MDNATYDTRIENGTNVYGSDGDKVGSIIGVTNRYIVVEKGFFFPTDYYIPRSAVSGQSHDGVKLNVTKDNALNQGWNNEPVDLNDAATDASYPGKGADAAGVMGSSSAAAGEYPADAADAGYATNAKDAGYTTSTTGMGYTGTGAATVSDDMVTDYRADRSMTDIASDNETIAIPVREEELIATKHAQELGSVRVEKVVSKEDRVLDVPVTEERVRVTRRAVDRVDSAGVGDDAFKETVLEAPVYGEDVDLSRRTRVVEEVDIDKEAVQSTRKVSGRVRRENVEVIDDVPGGVEGATDRDSGVIDPA